RTPQKRDAAGEMSCHSMIRIDDDQGRTAGVPGRGCSTRPLGVLGRLLAPPGGLMSSALQRRLWVPVALSYATFILVGVSAGVVGVLLPAQIDDYGVDKTTIGTTFFTSSAGFMLAGFNAGPLIHRFGVRTTLLIGCCAYILAGLITA